ncbi:MULTISPECIES: hypothetical protein [Micrococcus]|uniref:hypothetical protein n=1 Tax=Micrococcus antarcticus TaxID=86171 RepID=UPI00384DB444
MSKESNMLDGINPDGLEGWNTIAGFLLGSAVVLLMVAVAVGVAMAAWGRAMMSHQAARKGWAVVAMAGLGAVIIGSVGGGIAWGRGLGTAELMPVGARPGSVTVEKQAPKQTCNRQAVRDFVKESPVPDRAEKERVVSTVLGGQKELDGYTWGQDPGDMDTSRQVITGIKWYAQASANGSSEPDCSANNMTTPECSPVEVHVARQSMTNGAQTGRTVTLTKGENCKSS